MSPKSPPFSRVKKLELLTALLCCAAISFMFLGCEVDSADTVLRQVRDSVQGFYSNPNGGPIVEDNTGAAINSLNIRQDGDQLEAIDNNNQVFRGSLSARGDSYVFTLEGNTTAGSQAIMSGKFTVEGTTSTLIGTWIEESLYSTAFATATVTPQATNSTDRTPNFNQDFSGCCSGHGGVRRDSDSNVLFDDASGYLRCDDGTLSPSCNVYE